MDPFKQFDRIRRFHRNSSGARLRDCRPARSSRARMRMIPAHARVKKIANRFKLLKPFNDDLRPSRTRSRLHLEIREAKPTLNKSRTQMNILDARVSKIHFAPKQDSDLHVNSLRVEPVSQSVIPKEQIRQADENRREADQSANDVEPPKRRVGTLQLHDLLIGECVVHLALALTRLTPIRCSWKANSGRPSLATRRRLSKFPKIPLDYQPFVTYVSRSF